MSDDVEQYDSEDIEAPGLRGFIAQRPAWQKIMLVLSVALMVAGIGLGAYEAFGPEPDIAAVDSSGTIDPNLVSGLGPGEPRIGEGDPPDGGDGTGPAEGDGEGAAPKTGAALWSPAVFRLGFGFFAGFAVAAATRFLIKTIVIGAGIFLILLFGLEQAELVTVNWGIVGTRGDAILDAFGAQFSSLASFFAGYLPTTGAGVAGAVIGFRK